MMEPDRIDVMMKRASRVSSSALDAVKMDTVAHGALEELLTLGRDQDRATSLVARPPKKVRRGVVAGILAAALAGTTGAVAAGWTAHTRVEADGSTEMGSGELIRLDASDLDQVLVRLSQGIPFPSAASFDRAKENIRQVEPTQTSTSSLRSALAFNAACEWTGSWIDALHDGDETAMSAAQAVLDEIPTWSSISGGGMGKLLELRAEGARLGDPSLFQQEYDINCSGGSASSHSGS
jgi:hypothetical protein